MKKKNFVRPLSERLPPCPRCGQTMFRLHDIVGEYFVCRWKSCNERVSGIPYADYYRKKFKTAGNGEDGIWRAKAHGIFDVLWKEKGITRNDSYQVLQKIMGLSEEEAHISKFSKTQCQTLIKRLNEIGDLALVLSPSLPEVI